MKNIVILGAKGFIGKSLAEYLRRENDYNVIAVTRNAVDLLDAKAVEYFFSNNKVDVVIYTANQGGTRKEKFSDLDVIGNNLKMFFNVERCISKDIKMINFGSGAQYNKYRNLIKVSESCFDQFVPEDAYGYSKYVISKYIKEVNRNKKIYNPVIFALYGQGEDYSFRFISNAILKNILGMPIVINQDVVFDYLYIEDFFKIVKKIIDRDWPVREFNITPTESISLLEIAEYINHIGVCKSDISIKNMGFNYQYTGDNSCLMNQMEGEFEFTSYKKGIGKMYQYYLDNINSLDLFSVKNDKLINYCTAKGENKE